MSAEFIQMLAVVEARLDMVSREIEQLQGSPCGRCSRKDGDKIIGPVGDGTVLLGGYEAILCRACKNAWMVALEESGYWLEFIQADARLDLANKTLRGEPPSSRSQYASFEVAFASLDPLVAAAHLAERRVFQFSQTWMAASKEST